MRVSVRDQVEIDRSAAEARKLVLIPAEIDRYLSPPANTPFALEYAFHLLGDVAGKCVLDLGCGTGEEAEALKHRGARVIAIDISPDLIEIAKRRLGAVNDIDLRVGSAYNTELPDASVDVIFCMSLIHHLDIATVREEMLRVLRPGGYVILKEPIRFSGVYGWLRSLIPLQGDISEYEHPLTRQELQTMQQGFAVSGMRFFRLPFVPLLKRTLRLGRPASLVSSCLLDTFPSLAHYATSVVMRLEKVDS